MKDGRLRSGLVLLLERKVIRCNAKPCTSSTTHLLRMSLFGAKTEQAVEDVHLAQGSSVDVYSTGGSSLGALCSLLHMPLAPVEVLESRTLEESAKVSNVRRVAVKLGIVSCRAAPHPPVRFPLSSLCTSSILA